MFEIHARELRATFLRNYSVRHHTGPQAEDNSSTEDPRNPDSCHNRHKRGGAAPVTWRCTRTEEVHCLRIGCSAPTNKNKRGTGTPNHSPPHPSMRTWALLAAGWARRRRRHLHSGPLRHLLHPYMRRAGFRVRPLGCGSRGDLEGPRDAEVAPLAQEVITPHEGKRAQRVRQRRQLDIRSAATI